MRILGYFPTLKAANEAFRYLRAEGVTKAYVDTNNSNNKDITSSLPGTGLRTSIAEPNSNSPTFSNTTSSENNQLDASVDSYNFTLVVDAGEISAERIKNIISEVGGIVKEDSNTTDFK